MQSWLFLTLAIVLEVAGTLCMKRSDGFARLIPSIGILVFYLASFSCLTLALRGLDLSVAYAVWAGVGIVLVSLAGVWLFDETMTPFRAACVALVLIGVIGLKISSRS